VSSDRLDLTLTRLAHNAYEDRMKKSPIEVIKKVERRAEQSVTIDDFIRRLRVREPKLYERAALSVAAWLGRFESKRIEEIAPDGLPYAAGPKARGPGLGLIGLAQKSLEPKAPKVSLNDIISEYEQNLKESDA
jgi:hypothetical protein